MTCKGRDRRASTRHAAAEFRAWLGCLDEARFEVKAVKVLNISRGGMAVEMESQPVKQQSVWLRLHGDPELPTVCRRTWWTSPRGPAAVTGRTSSSPGRARSDCTAACSGGWAVQSRPPSWNYSAARGGSRS